MRYWILTLAALFAIVMLSDSSRAAIPSGSIVGMWLLDEGQGDMARDSSGNGNDGEIVGATWTDGRFGSALEFDGSSHVEILASETTDDYLDGFTYCIWAMPTAATTNANIRLIERDWHNPTIQMGPTDFYGSIAVNADQANTHVRGGLWQQGEWSFIALTYDGDAIKLYVDGEMVNEKNVGQADEAPANTTPPYEGSIWLGAWKAAGWDFVGVLDEAAVFNVPLSEDDIMDIMENGLTKAAAVSSFGKMATTWGDVKGIR